MRLLTRCNGGKFGSNLWIARVTHLRNILFAHCFRELLSDDMIAELFLVLHHPKIVIVTSTEQAIGEYLIIPTATGYHPDRSATRPELILPNFSRLNKAEGLLESLLEYGC